MRIAYWSQSQIPSRFANAVHVMKMCAAFASLGHGVSLFIPAIRTEVEKNDPWKYYGVAPCFDLHRIPVANRFSRLLFGSTANRFQTAAARINADLIYARCNTLDAMSLDTLMRPFVLELHVMPKSIESVKRCLARPFLQRLVVISQGLRDDLVKAVPEADSLLVVAHDGADPEPPTHAPLGAGAAGRLQIGYVGNLYAGRGIDLICELAQRCSWADFHFIGGSPNDVEKWTVVAKSLGGSNVVFHGYCEPASCATARSKCDVLLAPYQEETMLSDGVTNTVRWMSPLKMFEYMGSGRAIVCSDLPALREVVVDGVHALLCPASDIASWTDALTRLRDCAALRTRLGTNARELLCREFTWKHRAQKVLAGLK